MDSYEKLRVLARVSARKAKPFSERLMEEAFAAFSESLRWAKRELKANSQEQLDAINIAASNMATICLKQNIWHVPECESSQVHCGMLYLVNIREGRNEVPTGTHTTLSRGRLFCSEYACTLNPDHDGHSRPDPNEVVEFIPLDEDVPVGMR